MSYGLTATQAICTILLRADRSAGKAKQLGLALISGPWRPVALSLSALCFMNCIGFDSQQRLVIRNTGIGVHELLEWIEAGKTEVEIIVQHPCLEHADFDEVFRYGLFLTKTAEVSERLKKIRSEVTAKLNALHPKERP